ncbi:MAG: hypothetical protein D6725_07400 [Planctomycetota bacterium]|nr:MAG: hypothetical protein D6725_07400 [Planctomycetota bacterium]
MYVFRGNPCKHKLRVYAYYPGWPPTARVLGVPSGCLIPDPPFIRYRPPVSAPAPEPVPDVPPAPESPVPPEEPPPAPSTAATAAHAGRSEDGGAARIPARRAPALPARLLLIGERRHDAGLHFTAGFNLYWRGEYRAAARHFEAAVGLVPTDARFVMYHGLALLAQGRDAAGERLVRAAWRLARDGQADTLRRSLERVQGRLRQRIEGWRREEDASIPRGGKVARR